jgi:PilZ domain
MCRLPKLASTPCRVDLASNYTVGEPISTAMDRRMEPRIDCAEDVQVAWLQDARPRRQEALLLNISRSGARLHAAHGIPVGTRVEIIYSAGTFLGTVTHCLARKPSHTLGVRFASGSEWSFRTYRPKGAKGLGSAA